jgi:hypothetical protein
MNLADSILVEVLKNYGSFSEDDVPALAAAFPNLKVCAKMGCSTRFCVPAKDFADSIKMRLAANPADYVREGFIPADTYDALRAALGMSE